MSGTMPGRSRSFAIALVGLELLLLLCWSAGFIGTRYASAQAPIFLILFWRSIVTVALLLPFALAFGPRPIPPRAWREHAVVGLLAMFGYLAGYSAAIASGVPTGLVALIADMVPLAVALLSLPVLGERLSRRQWVGTIVGFLGVAVVSLDALRLGTAPLQAYLLPVLGMAALALATLRQKRPGHPHLPLHQSLFVQCLASSAAFAICAALEGGLMPPATPGFAIGIAWLIVVGTFGGYGVYFLCLRWSSASRVANVLYLSPPVTMLWAWAMFDEPLSWVMALGLLISLAGIVTASSASGPSRRAAGTLQGGVPCQGARGGCAPS